MRRREFITLLGGTAGAWPIVARAQRSGPMRRVAFLHGLAESDPEVQARIAAFREGLESLGWMDNRNIQVEHRFAGGDIARIQQHVAELVNSPPDVIRLRAGLGLASSLFATRCSAAANRFPYHRWMEDRPWCINHVHNAIKGIGY
jgi:hypothetical protein